VLGERLALRLVEHAKREQYRGNFRIEGVVQDACLCARRAAPKSVPK
jgi:hypothetical protein